MALRPNHEQLLGNLTENSLIKAALIMDLQGRVQGSRGSSNIIRSGSPTIQVAASLSGNKSKEKENVFMLEIDEGILIVIFQDGVDFERVRKLTLTVLSHLSIPAMT